MTEFEIKVFSEITENISVEGNVDVRIDLSDGRSFAATFFTIKNLILLLQSYKVSGECANGTYIWAKDMIVVESISDDTIRESVANLIETNEINTACTQIKDRRTVGTISEA